MTATVSAGPRSGPPPVPAWQAPAIVGAVFVAGAIAAASGLGAGGVSKDGVVLPLAAGAGLVLGVVALTRFRIYVMAMLVLRSSLDLAKLSGHTAGQSGNAVSGSSRALDPSSVLAVLFLLAAALWLAAQRRRLGVLKGSFLRRALVLLLAAGALSVVGSQNVSSSALEAMRICAVVVMFVVLEQMMADPAAMRKILIAAFLSTLYPLIFTSFGFLTGHPRSEHKGSFTRIVGTFNQSNDFGRYLMLMIIMGAAMYPHLDKKWRPPAALMMAGMSVFLLLTYTRSALVAAVLGLIVVGLVQSKRLLGALAAAAMAAMLVVPSLSGRFSDLSQSQSKSTTSQTSSSGNSLSWRLSYWTQVLPLANSNPVTGIGLNMTKYTTDQAKQPHNDFIRAYVETGLIGLFAYLAMMVALLGIGRRAVRDAPKGSFDRGVAAGFLGCAVAFVAVSSVANVISNVVNLWYFFAFAAAASAVAQRHESHSPEDPSATRTEPATIV